MFMQNPMQQWQQPRSEGAWCSQEAYMESSLRREDAQGYSAAGLMLYRRGDNGVEVLVTLERPWNSFINDYDPVAWNILGGKRAMGKGKEWDPHSTVVRNVLDIGGTIEGIPSARDLTRMVHRGPAVWYPRGKYALFLSEVAAEANETMSLLPERFLSGKKIGLLPAPQDEQRIGWDGRATTKWVKEIEALEWVPVSDMLKPSSELRKPLTNLLENLLSVEPFKKFAETGELPSNAQPIEIPENQELGGKEGGKSRNGKGNSGRGGFGKGDLKGHNQKGFDNRKGVKGGKGGKGDRGMMPPQGGKGGYGFPMMPQQQQQAPMMQMYSPEVQKQVLGEQIYILVQPMVPTAAIAQKVTGMLLELPVAELMPVMEGNAHTPPGQRSELRNRVEEALEVLQVEGFAVAS